MEEKKVVKKKVVKKKVTETDAAEKKTAKKKVTDKIPAEHKEHEKKDKEKKNIYIPKTKSQRFFKRYGVLLIIFFICSGIYFAWMYGVPAYFNWVCTPTKVNNFTEKHLGFSAYYKDSRFYTTPTLGLGVKFRDLKVMYPGSSPKSEQGLFMRVRLATFEVAAIPLMMRTIRFNHCGFRTAMVNLYQDEKNKYFYIENIKKHFNPQMPKYVLEVPTIELSSYSINNYNKNTDTFKKDKGNIMRITPAQTKGVLQNAPNAKTIMLK